MKNLIIACLIYVALIGSGYCEGVVRLVPGDTKQAVWLKLEAEIIEDSFRRDERADALVFNIVAKVQNDSNKDIELSAYSCSYMDDWITDNTSVALEFVTCKKNALNAFVLKPGEIYERLLTMRIPTSVTSDKIYFKLGYKAQRMTKGFERIPLEGQPFWSKDLVVHIARDRHQLKEKRGSADLLLVEDKLFELMIPADLKKIDVQGVDSYVGKYESASIKLSFDYGPYSDSLDNKNYQNYRAQDELINGSMARIVSYQQNDGGFVKAIHFAKAGRGFKGGKRLTVYVFYSNEFEDDIVMQMLRSIKFI